VNGVDRMHIPSIVRIVDGDRDTRDMYEALLGEGQFPVTRAGDAADAFEYAGYFHPDVLAHDEGEVARLIEEVREARERLAALIGSQVGRRPPRHRQRFIGH
jgi:DNA-binding response OmpR family regulator